MIEVYRIEKIKYLPAILEGVPGEKFTFRWNMRGHPIIYASESRSLALVEKFANLSAAPGQIPADHVIAAIGIPDKEYLKISPLSLPNGWDDYTTYLPETQQIGVDFLKSQELACFVPSVVVKGEWNVLLNPMVAGRLDLQVEEEGIDPRLVWKTG